VGEAPRNHHDIGTLKIPLSMPYGSHLLLKHGAVDMLDIMIAIRAGEDDYGDTHKAPLTRR
jgi:hypothetical protein